MAHPADQYCGDAECVQCVRHASKVMSRNAETLGVIQRNSGRLIPKPSAAEEYARQKKLDELRCADLRPRFERFERDLRKLKKLSHTPRDIPRWPGWIAAAALTLALWNAFSAFR